MRSVQNMLSLARPFGGLDLNANPEDIGPGDCAFCMDTETSAGTLRRRPRYVEAAIVSVESRVATNFKVFRLGDQNLIFLKYNDGPEALIRNLDTGNEITYTFAIDHPLPPQYVPALDRLYVLATEQNDFADEHVGQSCKVYLDADGNIKTARIGIAAPVLAPSAAQYINVADDLEAGTWDYRYTFYNSVAKIESSPSPPSSSVASSGNTVIVGITSTSSDPQVDKIRLYRRQKYGADGVTPVDATWYYLTELDNENAIFEDDIANLTLDRGNASEVPMPIDSPTDDPSLPPECNVAAWHNNRMFYGGVNGKLYVSQLNNPDRLQPGLQWVISRSSTDPIRAMISAFGYLFIFTTRRCYYITGTGPETYVIDDVSATIGCIARDSLLEIDGAIYFASRQGICRMSTDGPEMISEPIGPLWRSIVHNALDRAHLMSAAYEPTSGHYVLNYSQSTGRFSAADIDGSRTPPDELPPERDNDGGGISLGTSGDPLQLSKVIGSDGTNNDLAPDDGDDVDDGRDLPTGLGPWFQLAFDVQRGKWQRWSMDSTWLANAVVPRTGTYSLLLSFEIGGTPRGISYMDGQRGGDYGYDANAAFYWRTGDVDFGLLRCKKFYYMGIAWHEAHVEDYPAVLRPQFRVDHRDWRELEAAGVDRDIPTPDRRKAWELASGGRTLTINLKVDQAPSTVSITGITVDTEAIGFQ